MKKKNEVYANIVFYGKNKKQGKRQVRASYSGVNTAENIEKMLNMWRQWYE